MSQDSSENASDKSPDRPESAAGERPESTAGERPESPSEQPPSTPAQPPAAAPASGAGVAPGEEPLDQPLGSAQAPPPGPPAGAPPAGAPPAGAPPPGAPEAAPRKRRTSLIVGGVVAGVLALLCVGVIALVVFTSGGEIPAAGDCLTDAPDPNDMEVVDCGAGDAAWTVLGADRTMTRGEFSGLTQQDDVCQDYPEREQALWVTDSRFGVDDDTEGTVLCLQRVGG